MNILIITQRAGSGSGWERYTHDLAMSLRGAGHSVDILAAKGPARFRVPLPDPLRYKLLSCISLPLALWFRFTHRNDLRRYDVVHCVIEPYAPFARWVARSAGKPYVLTVHGSFSVKTLTANFRMLQRRAYADAGRIISVSEYTKARLLEEVNVSNVVVVPNGVSGTSFFSDADTPREPHLLFSVGALKPRKGQHLLIEALAEVRTKIGDVRCVFAGSESVAPAYVAQLKRRASELGLSEVVEFAGRVSDERLHELYAKGSLFALTPVSTRSDFEGFGLVYLEANACGVPVIGMEGSGAADAIAEGKSGLIAKQGDVHDLAEKIVRILTDDALRERLSTGARAWAREHDWKYVVERYVAVYEDVVQDRRR